MYIRTASVEDAAQILSIYAYYVENTAITFEYDVPSIEEFKMRIQNILEKYPYIVAVEEDRIIGYAYVNTFKGRKAYDWSVETSIYIEKTQKKKGIGRLLYSKLESICKAMGIKNMYACIASPIKVNQYLDYNSIQFHEHLGYKTVGTFHKCGYKNNEWYDMVWMEKIIGVHDSCTDDVIKFTNKFL